MMRTIVMLALFIAGCGPEVIVECEGPLPVEYCTTGDLVPCVRGDTIGVCYVPGVCAARCAIASECAPVDCRIARCDDGACVYDDADCD